MTRARDIANLVDANGDIVAGALDNVPAADVVNDTTPQLGGDLQSNSNDVVFADNDKAIFGAGNDLQIYHDGSNSIIAEASVGSLKIQGSDLYLTDDDGTNMLYAANNGGVTLYQGGGARLATTSTGVDVTGNVTVDAEGGSATVDVRQGSAKVWSNIDGGANSVRDSYNLSSMTDLGSGQPQANFSNNMSNSNYAVPFNTGGHNGVNRMDSMRGLENGSFTTSKCSFYTGAESNLQYYDSSNVHSAVFGDLA